MSTELIESIADFIDDVVPPEIDFIGFVPQDYEGKFLVTEPEGHPGGTAATWSKLKKLTGEKPHRALLRLYHECLAGHIHSLFPLPFCWTGSTGTIFYFTGMFHGGTPPNSSIRSMKWLPEPEVRLAFAHSANPSARKRDLALLAAAQHVSPTSTRRILLMVSELHKLGFERLRIAPQIGPTGFAWRCDILPASCISDRHGALPNDDTESFLHLVGDGGYRRYTSGVGFEFCTKPFEWTDAPFDSPRGLADKFIARFPRVAFAGFGRDAEYVAWYKQMLNQTAPFGLVASYSDGPSPVSYEYLEIYFMPGSPVRIPVPPPPRN